MKSTTFFSIILIALLSTFTSCKKGGPFGIIGKGSNVTETRDISGFDRIRLTTEADVIYTQDSTYYVEVNGQKNIIDVLDLKNENGTLQIGFDKNVWKHNKIKIIIHSPNIYGLFISGSGDIKSYTKINTSYLNLGISGSGDIELNTVVATTMDAKISGSGDIDIETGEVNTQNLQISGSGEMDLEQLASTNCLCKISGSGDMSVKALENLDVQISGSGDVSYSGRPVINSKITGSGKLSRH